MIILPCGAGRELPGGSGAGPVARGAGPVAPESAPWRGKPARWSGLRALAEGPARGAETRAKERKHGPKRGRGSRCPALLAGWRRWAR
jgi:hypothetical protein